MAWIRVVDEEDADGELKIAYGRVKTTRGTVANIFRVQSLDPRSLQAHLDLYLSLMFGGGKLSRQQRELIAVVVSAENDCHYCVEHHSKALGRYVKDEEFIAKLVANPREAPLEPKERAMVDYALALTSDSHSLTREAVEGLRRVGMSDEEILQLNLVASYFNFVNRIANGLGVSLEEEQSSYRY
ncbi:MAG: peroxidase-related enzyme [Thaumarchaeota archaeon]|nr:peroxidase-related enzyme [Nitrososphaerota archaeon]